MSIILYLLNAPRTSCTCIRINKKMHHGVLVLKMIGIIKRYIDIALYSVISWLLISYIGQSEFAKKAIEGWRQFNDSLPYPVDYATYFIAGLLTKHILVNCGDYNFHHELHNEKRFVIKDEKELSKLGWFTIKNKLCLFIVNPPLRLSIIFYFGIIITTSSPEINGEYITPILFYILGILIPQTIRSFFSSTPKIISINDEPTKPYPDEWYQYERPISDVNEDCLGRGALVKRLYNIITRDDITDARGIAIVGGYGMGKTSLINMTLNQVMLNSHNFVTCHITTWGNYTSEENIQKIVIEQIISDVTKITSTTSLSGLPSKYINALKGAQSLWLDTLPLLDCHASAHSQLDKLNELLSRINHKVIFVVEDIDRNDDKLKILNSVASLIEKLNSYPNFRVILSIGEELYKPEIINRVCRYKENITFDDNFKFDAIQNSIKDLLLKSKLTYKSSEVLFDEKQSPKLKELICTLLSYVTNFRDLKAVLRELSYDWNIILCGSCDIIDLLAFNIFKQFKPALIGYISENQNNLNPEKIKGIISKDDTINADIICNYLFDYNQATDKLYRLQSLLFAPSKYIPLLIEKKPLERKGRIIDQELFFVVEQIKKISASNYDEKSSIKIAKLLFKAGRLAPSYYIKNAWKYLFNSYSLVVILYQLQYKLLIRKIETNRHLDAIEQAANIINIHNTLIYQQDTCNEIIKNIVKYQLLKKNIVTLNDIYINVLNPLKNDLVYRPSTVEIIEFYEQEYNRIKLSKPDEIFQVISDAMFTMYRICMKDTNNKENEDAFIEPFKKLKSEFIEEFLGSIERWADTYQAGSFKGDQYRIANWYQRLLDQHQ
ncbi:P-loop NTPase fold protein [Aeromonas jandaei]|uniref:P-loop NTPase fold protein n=1 Tax=Aeromonas jandaei TaxID=650 RepID=UPI001ABF6F1F|nr:P-loop NTPase fold protein [Aeromonas jandaei]QSR73468.1 hypothetical protein GP488_14005 [Aeromonas jandaei]